MVSQAGLEFTMQLSYFWSSCLQLLSIRITDTILSCLVFVSSFDVAEMCINGHGCLVCGRSSLCHHMNRYHGRSSLCHRMSRYLGTQGCCDFITTTGNLTNFQGLKPKPQLSPLGHLILFQSQICPDHGHCTQIQVSPNTNVLTGNNSRKLFLVELKKTMSQGALIYIGGNIRRNQCYRLQRPPDILNFEARGSFIHSKMISQQSSLVCTEAANK